MSFQSPDWPDAIYRAVSQCIASAQAVEIKDASPTNNIGLNIGLDYGPSFAFSKSQLARSIF